MRFSVLKVMLSDTSCLVCFGGGALNYLQIRGGGIFGEGEFHIFCKFTYEFADGARICFPMKHILPY